MKRLRNCVLGCFLALTLHLGAAARETRQSTWIGTWAAAPQAAIRGSFQTFHNQTIRLIVHSSAGGKSVRIKISNTFADQPLLIGAAHIARRASEADIDPASDRALKFHGSPSTAIPPHSMMVSDPADLDVPALSDLAISLFFSATAAMTTWHVLAKQTNYISPETGDATAQVKFPVAKTIDSWPFLTGVDVASSPRAATIVALGSSLTDGDGSIGDTNRRWPDVLAERLQKDPAGNKELGVLNEGIIGNRLLSDTQSPRQTGGPPPLGAVFEELGPALGQSGVARFDRDVLSQAGVKYVILALGVNDTLFPGSFIPQSESVTAKDLITGNRQLIARAHKKGIRVIGTTIPPFEQASSATLSMTVSTLPRKRRSARRSTPGFAAAASSMVSSILTKPSATRTIPPKSWPPTTAATICTSTTPATSPKATPSPCPCSTAINTFSPIAGVDRFSFFRIRYGTVIMPHAKSTWSSASHSVFSSGGFR